MSKNNVDKDNRTVSQLDNQTPLTKTQKNNRRLIKLLEQRYPKAFNWQNPKPLKIGIDKDISVDEVLTASKLKRALAAYTKSTRYRKCLLKHTERIDLDGLPAGSQYLEADKNSFTKRSVAGKEAVNKKAVVKQRKNTDQTNKKDELAHYNQEERIQAKLALLISKTTKK